MVRVRNVPAGRRRRKKVLKKAKGFRQGRSKLYKHAQQFTERAALYSWRDRRQRKRDFRRLWITRISAAAKINGISYSKLMAGLRKANLSLDRKMLADLAVSDEPTFQKLTKIAKEKLSLT